MVTLLSTGNALNCQEFRAFAGRQEARSRLLLPAEDAVGVVTVRCGKVARKTRETTVEVELDLDGSGKAVIATGLPFFDHLLSAFACHGRFDLSVQATGDIQVDGHHMVEDVGLAMGLALTQALGKREGLRRWGWALLPMDEALVQVAADLGGRSFLVYRVPVSPRSFGDFHTEMATDFWQAFSQKGGITLHVNLEYGENAHHVLEAVWKAAGVALRAAAALDDRVSGPLSTKGVLDLPAGS